jgi:hypothetical protein
MIEKKRLLDNSLRAVEGVMRVFQRNSILTSPFFGSVTDSLIFRLVEDLKRSRTSIDEKIQNAYKSMQETHELIDELEESLKERTEKLSLLSQEYERYSRLAELEEDKASVNTATRIVSWKREKSSTLGEFIYQPYCRNYHLHIGAFIKSHN